MNIREFSHTLQKVYDEMGETFSSLQRSTKLPCLPGCGHCCLNPEIEATPLELIPMALKIYDEGKLEEWYEKLGHGEGKACFMFNGKNCDSYRERPSVCRMFGVAGYYNKQHEVTLSICKLIKEALPEQTRQALAATSSETPVMAQWASRLSAIDPKIAEGRQPLNLALRIALEKVALWSQYNE